eukprot:RCo044393
MASQSSSRLLLWPQSSSDVAKAEKRLRSALSSSSYERLAPRPQAIGIWSDSDFPKSHGGDSTGLLSCTEIPVQREPSAWTVLPVYSHRATLAPAPGPQRSFFYSGRGAEYLPTFQSSGAFTVFLREAIAQEKVAKRRLKRECKLLDAAIAQFGGAELVGYSSPSDFDYEDCEGGKCSRGSQDVLLQQISVLTSDVHAARQEQQQQWVSFTERERQNQELVAKLQQQLKEAAEVLSQANIMLSTQQPDSAFPSPSAFAHAHLFYPSEYPTQNNVTGSILHDTSERDGPKPPPVMPLDPAVHPANGIPHPTEKIVSKQNVFVPAAVPTPPPAHTPAPAPAPVVPHSDPSPVPEPSRDFCPPGLPSQQSYIPLPTRPPHTSVVESTPAPDDVEVLPSNRVLRFLRGGGVPAESSSRASSPAPPAQRSAPTASSSDGVPPPSGHLRSVMFGQIPARATSPQPLPPAPATAVRAVTSPETAGTTEGTDSGDPKKKKKRNKNKKGKVAESSSLARSSVPKPQKGDVEQSRTIDADAR